jgi:HlyD family secretion protein
MRVLFSFSVLFLSGLLAACSDSSDSLPGYVEGRYIYAASYSSGYLEHLNVHRGQRVKAGQVLFVLNNEPETDELTESIANAASARETLQDKHLGERPSEITAIQEQIRGALATANYANWLYKHNKRLVAGKVISISDLKQYQTTARADTATTHQLQAELVTARLGARIHQQLAQLETYKSSLAAVKKQQWILSTKTYVAPGAGFIQDTFYREGEFISTNQAVLSLLEPQHVKLIFYVPEPKLGRLKLGQPIGFSCDGCQSAQAHIDYISSQAEYTPPVLYTRSARKSLVYRVEAGLAENIALNYHPGQPVTISLVTGRG